MHHPHGHDTHPLSRTHTSITYTHTHHVCTLTSRHVCVTPNRRTGLVVDKSVSKDSDGFDDLDAFWASTKGV